MPSYYDDNFGWYEIDGPEDVEFYHQVQAESVWKRCAHCNQKVRIRRDYSICNSCAERIERGLDAD